MISSIVSRLVILLFGTLYPAYASYKAVRTKDVREYVKWMMYWIVFALFTCAETFTDVLLSFWFPFYYELKIIVVLWLLSPATKGSSILYRKFVHPTLTKREKEIDEAIMHAKAQGYSTILRLGARGIDYAKYVIMQTAIKGGGGLVNQLRKSYSLSDLTEHQEEPRYRAIGLRSLQEEHDGVEHWDEDRRYVRRQPLPPGYQSGSPSSPIDVYFSEFDLDLKQRGRAGIPVMRGHPQSLEDVSSGYSSIDQLFTSSPGHSPISECANEDYLSRSTSISSTNIKSRKPFFSGNMANNKSAESSVREEMIGSVLGSSDDSQDCKEKEARAGRYKKLRAPGPPSTSKPTCDIKSMSDSEHGTVLRARMCLLSSYQSSGSVNILVESSAGVSATMHGTKLTRSLVHVKKGGATTNNAFSAVRNSPHCKSLPNLCKLPLSFHPQFLQTP